MKTLDQRINNVIGQLKAIKEMNASGEDCFKIITQMRAARAGFSAIMRIYVEEQLDKCKMFSVDEVDKEKIYQLLAEVLKD